MVSQDVLGGFGTCEAHLHMQFEDGFVMFYLTEED